MPAKSVLHGIGRPQLRHAAPAFERLDERGLLAADKGPGPFANLEMQRAEKAARLCLADRAAHAIDR